MPTKGPEYEHEVLHYLKEQLAHLKLGDYELRSPGIQSGSSNRRAGVSGYRHQIDISAEYERPGERCLLLVECKDWKNKITLGAVLVFLGRVADIEPHYKEECKKEGYKGTIERLMYARNGYTWPAKIVAHEHGITFLYLSDDGATIRFMGTASVLLKPPAATATAGGLPATVTTTST